VANINTNLTNTVISPADETTLKTSRADMMTLIQPYFVALTDDERASLFSLKEENLVFAHLALQQANSLGNLIPPALSSLVTNLNNDLTLHTQLAELENDFIRQLARKTADTKRRAAHEAYTGAIAVYKIIEALNAVGVDGAKEAYEVLKERFANQGGTGNAQPNP
jgi:hypothetical protein